MMRQAVAAIIYDGNASPLTYNANGRAAAASSTPVVLPNEDQRNVRPNGNLRILASAATINAQGAGALANARAVHKITLRKATATACFLKLVDKATAAAAGDAFFYTIDLTTAGFYDIDLKGYPLTLGLGMVLTGLVADADNTAIAANDVIGLNIAYAT